MKHLSLPELLDISLILGHQPLPPVCPSGWYVDLAYTMLLDSLILRFCVSLFLAPPRAYDSAGAEWVLSKYLLNR